MEKTFLMIKPDGVQRNVMGDIISRFEQKGFQLRAGKFTVLSQEQAEKHYEEHKDKPFFGELIEFITSGPVFAMVWEGDNIIQISRMMIGKTDPIDAQPGTIRGDFAAHKNLNIIHGSDSNESAVREIENVFTDSELVSYEKTLAPWI
ncbi:nucleoside-diphosphate kinase [Chengkuizengella axinellae]|uniref:Nucleoside diphosphate kinase n=1 Tax=Chengkuizengella axinellae TaxID=3064388 RepID=A0ABT9IWR7_9BACL|nr:nucleoside-diphosphate kinase [Chengkuizengella sp. 2205SS18-9]MDP5273801.1 nucleoside-diphosphate kinase [Chengkuizengella sp. 2205SS18-9]